MTLKPIVKIAAKFIQKNATKILAGGAIISEVLGFWMMHKRAPIVREKLDALPEDATTVDKIKTAAPLYLPAALMLVASSGCIIGGCALGEARLAAMTNLAMMSEAALAKYEQKVVEKIGEEAAKKLHDEAAKEVIAQKALPQPPASIIATRNGSDIFYEPLTNRYFMSCEKAVNDAAAKFTKARLGGSADMSATVNEWFDALDIPHAVLGEYACWNVDHPLDITIPYEWETMPDGRPCKRICYFELPLRLDGSDYRARD